MKAGTGSWKGAQPGQLVQTDKRDVPYRVEFLSAIKAGGRNRGDIRSYNVCLPKKVLFVLETHFS